MMNKLFLGFSKTVELPKRPFLFIHDEVPDIFRSVVFDPTQSSFNPLENLDYRRARDLADVLYTISPEGAATLTVRNGKRDLLPALLASTRLDKLKGSEEVQALIANLLLSPVLKNALCDQARLFPFNPKAIILARINRAELGDFDALVLGLFLINHYKGQLVIPDFGFYGRIPHTNLIRQHRLIAGVNYLAELPLQLRLTVLSMQDKKASGALYEDADTLARHARLIPGTNAFSDFVSQAMH